MLQMCVICKRFQDDGLSLEVTTSNGTDEFPFICQVCMNEIWELTRRELENQVKEEFNNKIEDLKTVLDKLKLA